MRWFWRGNEKSSPELEAMRQLKEQNNLLVDQCRELAEQVTKLSRLQYKTSKDIQEKVGGISDSFTTFIKKQEHGDSEKQLRIKQTEAKIQELAHSLIRWLDDLDLICSGLMDNGEEEWKKILMQWSNQILNQLESLGILELHVIGTSFNPTIAESLGTLSKKEAEMKYKKVNSQASIPYQVVEVLKRGFVWKNGTLLRKAQVITLRGE